ncbi:MAG: DNA polymerase III subunit epsilon [Rhodospirillales bacterium]
MREVVFDTETTGLDPAEGHRLVEVAGIELINHLPTGRTFQRHINPERSVPEEAQRVHGLSEEFLADKPRFAEVADELLEFLGDSKLVIHNAAFDMKFINWELKAVDRPTLPSDRAKDTLAMARRRYPGAQASLDALCRRFGIDNSARGHHDALLDCELLAEVYLELIGGRQPQFLLAAEAVRQSKAVEAQASRPEAPSRPSRPHSASPAELEAHEKMLDQLKDPLWRR